jgi:hypothetical protein
MKRANQCAIVPRYARKGKYWPGMASMLRRYPPGAFAGRRAINSRASSIPEPISIFFARCDARPCVSSQPARNDRLRLS